MKNAINYITRAATVEQNDGGLQAQHEFYANLAKHVNAELKRTEKDAIAAEKGLAIRPSSASSARPSSAAPTTPKPALSAEEQEEAEDDEQSKTAAAAEQCRSFKK